MRTLTADDFDAVCSAFIEAFSDYVVKMSPTREQLLEMITRRGYVPEASVGVFEGDRVVAFTLNGIDGSAAYDTGTGVVPSHRRRGLARAMMDFVLPVLAERGCERYVLEVIEQNRSAYDLYRECGFVETRRLQCWSFTPSVAPHPVTGERGKIREDWWDVEPSWQNSSASVARARDPHVVIGDDDGFAIVFPGNGDLPQLAVKRDMRRRGIGTRLLHQAAAVAGKPLRILNVDDRDEGIARFLERAGAQRTVRQIEMERAVLRPRA